MNQLTRHKRLRVLVRELNQQRKQQGQKIDILCHDLITAQREFIKRLEQISFTSMFYRSMLGVSDVDTVLHIAGTFFSDMLPDARVYCWIKRNPKWDCRLLWDGFQIEHESEALERYFSDEVIQDICLSRHCCALGDCVQKGLSISAEIEARYSVAVLPLFDKWRSVGAILIYGDSEHPLENKNIERIEYVTSGLSKAIETCLASSQPS